MSPGKEAEVGITMNFKLDAKDIVGFHSVNKLEAKCQNNRWLTLVGLPGVCRVFSFFILSFSSVGV